MHSRFCRRLQRCRGMTFLLIDTAPEKSFDRLTWLAGQIQSCTAKMGCDPMSVVDHGLKVYGIKNLRIADASIMPNITSGNTMAPCVVIGERAAEIIKVTHII